MQISFAVTAKLISAFVFATRIVQFLFYLNPKFQASSSFLSLYRPVCVGPGRKPRRPVFSRRGSYTKLHHYFSKSCRSGPDNAGTAEPQKIEIDMYWPINLERRSLALFLVAKTKLLLSFHFSPQASFPHDAVQFCFMFSYTHYARKIIKKIRDFCCCH